MNVLLYLNLKKKETTEACSHTLSSLQTGPREGVWWHHVDSPSLPSQRPWWVMQSLVGSLHASARIRQTSSCLPLLFSLGSQVILRNSTERPVWKMKLREADSNAGYLCKYSSMLSLSEPLFPKLFICKISGLILKAPWSPTFCGSCYFPLSSEKQCDSNLSSMHMWIYQELMKLCGFPWWLKW